MGGGAVCSPRGRRAGCGGGPSWFDSCALACPAARAARRALPTNPARITTSPTRAPPASLCYRGIFHQDDPWGASGIWCRRGVRRRDHLLHLAAQGPDSAAEQGADRVDVKMQAIQPAKRYRTSTRPRPARLNQELQALYQDNQVNPLAGCLRRSLDSSSSACAVRCSTSRRRTRSRSPSSGCVARGPRRTQGSSGSPRSWSNGARRWAARHTVLVLGAPRRQPVHLDVDPPPKPTDESQQQNRRSSNFSR